ncbi:MAG: hypothetical protein IPN79_17215 [Saprospiraceae bacterium]|nr:hypothetical protein [Saprospiraceae bacterium]
MDKKICLYIIFFITIFCDVYGQKPYVQLQTSGGYSIPLMDASNTTHFVDPGWNANLAFSMFYGKFGIMAGGGYQRNNAYAPFQRYIVDKYKEFPSVNNQYWTNAYGMFGPAFKLTFGKAEIDFFAQIGMANLSVPELPYSKRLFGQNVEIARYNGENTELTPFWKGGFTFHYRVYKSLGICLEPSFLSNMYLRKTKTSFRYVDAFDNNQNGVVDEVEFTEAPIVRDFREIVFSSANINLGVSLQLGRTPKQVKPVPMISVDDTVPVTDSDKTSEQPIVVTDDKKMDDTINASESGKIPAENKIVKTDTTDITSVDSLPSVSKTEIDVTDKSETQYDEAEAGFLYKAGELYFQTNDFENAVACFNKIKNDPNQLMAKYMFALSMCEMLNCEEAEKEYQLFSELYNHGDKGVLHTVYKSHQKKCLSDLEEQKKEALRRENEILANNYNPSASKNPVDDGIKGESVNTNKTTPGDKTGKFVSQDGKTYKIQFVALRLSNKTFPKMEGIGNITHEFYPKKSMYRYTLGPFDTEDEAVSDMLKVRAMGFQDAFLAVYKNGKRINTLYHAR